MLTTSIRPAAIIGIGAFQVVAPMVQAYFDGNTKWQIGDNNNLFDFTCVVNVAHAHLLAARALVRTIEYESQGKTLPDIDRVDGETFFITNDGPVYFWDFPRMIWKYCGDTRGINVWVLPKPVGLFIATIGETIMPLFGKQPNLSRFRVTFSCLTRYFNISKAKTRLGYQPIQTLEEGVKEATEWFLKDLEETKKRAVAK
jgi:sterol-4alpha-carboxylate 3-dehydrogenase (decarboxylating)